MYKKCINKERVVGICSPAIKSSQLSNAISQLKFYISYCF